MSAQLLNDARHLRDRAAQIRVLSDWTNDPQTRGRMLKLAIEYDKLAEQADIRSESCSVAIAVPSHFRQSQCLQFAPHSRISLSVVA